MSPPAAAGAADSGDQPEAEEPAVPRRAGEARGFVEAAPAVNGRQHRPERPERPEGSSEELVSVQQRPPRLGEGGQEAGGGRDRECMRNRENREGGRKEEAMI